jgi:zinc protease
MNKQPNAGNSSEYYLPYLEDPAILHTYQNGHRLIIIRKPGDILHLQTNVLVGASYEDETNNGVSHFLEHLMFKGTAKYPVGEFDKIMEGMGARINAATSDDCTYYYATFPKDDDGANLRLAMELQADMLMNSALPAEEIGPEIDLNDMENGEKRERMVVLEEILMGKDNPFRRAIKKLNELLMPTHPYRREVIGTQDIIAHISREDIYAFYRKWYVPNAMVTTVAGEVDPAEIIEMVAKYYDFADCKPAIYPQLTMDNPPTRNTVTVTAPQNVAYIITGFLTPPAKKVEDTCALDAISLILGGSVSCRMQMELIEKLPNTPFIAVGGGNYTMRDCGRYLNYAIVNHERVEEAQELFMGVLNRIITDPPTLSELDMAKICLESQFATQVERVVGMADLASSMMVENMGLDYVQKNLDIIRSLTIDDLKNTAEKYLNTDNSCTVLVMPGEGNE